MLPSDVSISCRGLSKQYTVTTARTRGTLRRSRDTFQALSDVSFDITAGSVVGIVGRNGAGKSTLLKILSRITQPSSGEAIVRGRVAGLLEVGTGFHPELTGRENIYLNGTLLGMSRREVASRFDEIVDFAGVDYFLDTPVKRYSSGMYVRLAFAVAAHLRNEVLVLDEVLAVGDAAFQRKCLGKMQELAQGDGRTVLMVSHNAQAIRQHATSALRLEAGALTLEGSVEAVLSAYEDQDSSHVADTRSSVRVDSNWARVARIVRVEVGGQGRVPMGGDLEYIVDVDVPSTVDLGVGQAITTLDDRPVAASFSEPMKLASGLSRISVSVPCRGLAPGRYSMNVVVGRASFSVPDLHYDGVMHPVAFEVTTPEDSIVDWHPEWWGHFALAPTQIRLSDRAT